MSWYTSTYVGIQDKDGKIYPFGPYDANGELRSIYTHSKSFTSDINGEFDIITDDMVTDELRNEEEFKWLLEEEDGNTGLRSYFGYLSEENIPKGSYIKNGYCLISQISDYLDSDVYWEEFYPILSPMEYAMRMENELKFGPPKPKKDDFGEEYTEHSCSEFSYFSWPDYNCREYEAALMRNAIDMFDNYKLRDQGFKFVIIKKEG